MNESVMHYDDEISITDILKKIWWRRGIVLLVPFLFALLAVIYIVLTNIRTTAPTVYFVELNGITNGRYPNGTNFSPQDLLIAEVLDKAYQQVGLTAQERFRDAIQVEYGMPSDAGMRKTYQERLATKGLASAELELINTEYLNALKKLSERGLRITINHAQLGISSEVAAALANALPRAWSEVYTTKYRVLVDTRLENVAVINSASSLTTTSEILSARNMLKRMERGLEIVGTDIRLKSITSEAKLNSADLKSELSFFNEVYFRPLLAGLFSNPDQSAASFLAETKLEIKEIDRKIEELGRSINDIRSFRLNTTSSSLSENTGETVQFGDNTLGQVIDLANKASLSDYLTQILSSRGELISQRAALERELERSLMKLDTTDDKQYIDKAVVHYSNLTKQYSSLLRNAREVSRNNYGSFFQPLGSPYVSREALPEKAPLIAALAVGMGFFLALLIVLVLPLPGQKDQK